MTTRASQIVLRLAAVHCLAWGVFILAAPVVSARIYGFDKPLTDGFLWSGTGLAIFLFGVGYAIAATDPIRHVAPIVVGLTAKVLGPVGMVLSVVRGEVSSGVLWLLPVNDVVWWIPFGLILRQAWRDRQRFTDPQKNGNDP